MIRPTDITNRLPERKPRVLQLTLILVTLLVVLLVSAAPLEGATALANGSRQERGPNQVIAALQQVEDEALPYSSYLGGGSWETATSVAADQAGNLYLAGRTASADFPTTAGALKTTTGDVDAFLVKLPPGGRAPLFATLIGGSGQDGAYDLTVQDGLVYICGETWSDDFPSAEGSAGESDAFLAVLDADSGELLSASTFGGEDQDIAYGVAVEDGQVYLAGSTYSDSFAGIESNPSLDAFALKLDPAGGVAYLTLLGGRSEDAAFDIAVADGEAYLVGQTWSSNFPAEGFSGQDDAFLVRLDRQGAPALSRLIGGSDQDSASALLLDQGVWIVGSTDSPDFPVSAGSYSGGGDAFVTWLSEEGETRFATTLGGSGLDEGAGISQDASGSLQITGSTASTDFPVSTGALQPAIGGRSDAFLVRLAQLDGAGFGLGYATYLGGADQERGGASAAAGENEVILVGYTNSADFPVTSQAISQSLRGSQDAFTAVLSIPPLQASPPGPLATSPPAATAAPGSTPEAATSAAGQLAPTTAAATDPVSPPGAPAGQEPDLAEPSVPEPTQTPVSPPGEVVITPPAESTTAGTGPTATTVESMDIETTPSGQETVNLGVVIGILLAGGLLLVVFFVVSRLRDRPGDNNTDGEQEEDR